MKTLPSELFRKYVENPLLMDETVRQYCDLPDNRYYTVSTWPVEGQVRSNNQIRVKKVNKINKSDQK